jgi:hypothetical protein
VCKCCPAGVEHSRKDSVSSPGVSFRSYDDTGSSPGKQLSGAAAVYEKERQDIGVLPMPRFALRAGPR